MYELFDHTADLGLRVRAATLEELLVEAARGLLAMHVANPEAVRPAQSRTIELTADDPAYLMFDWLSELLYAFESDKLLLCEFDVQLTSRAVPPKREGEAPAEPDQTRKSGTPQRALPTALTATCRGEPMDETRHTMDHEVKAITYHGLSVSQTADGSWQAEVIVDI
jgi:SHS2 domain-containing protein